jgi:hypothetical protein
MKKMPENIFQFGSRSRCWYLAQSTSEPERTGRCESQLYFPNRVPLYVGFTLSSQFSSVHNWPCLDFSGTWFRKGNLAWKAMKEDVKAITQQHPALLYCMLPLLNEIFLFGYIRRRLRITAPVAFRF